MNRMHTAVAVSGLAAGIAQGSVTVSVDATKTSVGIGESVTWTVTATLDDSALPPPVFSYYFRWAFLDIINTGSATGTVSSFEFNHDTLDLNMAGQPLAVIANSQPTGSDLLSVHWLVNFVTGDTLNDVIMGDTFASPYVLGSFTFTPDALGNATYDVQTDQDYIDTQNTVNAGFAWGRDSLSASLDFEEFNSWNLVSDVVNVVPAPGAPLTAGLALVLLGRRRR